MSKRALGKAIWAIILVVILIVAIGAGVYYYESTKSTSSSSSGFTLKASASSTTQGTAITFTLSNFASNGQATIYFGDGQSATGLTASSPTASHTYQYGGTFLVTAEETVGGSVVASTNNAVSTIQISPSISSSSAPVISVPVISMNTTLNPTEPIVTVNTAAYFAGGYLEAPSATNVIICEYVWDFGNGVNQTVSANSSTNNPEVNPVKATYSQTGLYPVSLTIVTENSATKQTYCTTIERTVVVSSSTQPYALYSGSSKVPNAGVINVVENVAGGPYSFDPQVDYESVGYEVVLNTMATLLVYDGSSTTTFLPMLASSIPSTSNGGITNNSTTYTFTIRTGLKFSNGDPITAYDVYYTMVRNLLFLGGAPGTPDWILAQYLIPGATAGVPILSSATDTKDYNAILNAVTYSNSANTVTFNLVTPTSPAEFFTAIAFPLGTGVLDHSWLQSIGAGITFSASGFYSYQSQANEGNYNTKIQNNPVSSGPYQIESYVPGQSVVLIPNSGWTGVSGIPAVKDTISIQWVKDPETAYLLYSSGSTDIVTGLPNSDMPSIKGMVSAGQSSLYQISSLSCFFYVFNTNVTTSLMKSVFGSNFNMPQNYFANTDVREAFADAFNYTNYIDQIVGNKVYGEDFASPYCGVIIPGLPYYVPESDLSGVPTYDLSAASQLMQQSGEGNVQVNIPIIVTAGDPINYAGAQMWAAALHQMDPSITATPVYEPFTNIIGYQVAGGNPMPLYYLGWIADYPYPSDFVNAMYEQGATYPAAMGFNVDYFNKIGQSAEATQYQQLNTEIQQADTATNPTTAQTLYKTAEQNAVNLYMYVYTQQPSSFWIVKPYMKGYNGIQSEENPMIGGAADSIYYWWVKG
jgi:ABC-type transport system substrate-binding protein